MPNTAVCDRPVDLGADTDQPVTAPCQLPDAHPGPCDPDPGPKTRCDNPVLRAEACAFEVGHPGPCREYALMDFSAPGSSAGTISARRLGRVVHAFASALEAGSLPPAGRGGVAGALADLGASLASGALVIEGE